MDCLVHKDIREDCTLFSEICQTLMSELQSWARGKGGLRLNHFLPGSLEMPQCRASGKRSREKMKKESKKGNEWPSSGN